jgi:hypothetical protein
LIDSILALVLTGLLVLAAAGFGHEILQRFALDGLTLLERALLSAGLGLATLGCMSFILGIARQLSVGLITVTFLGIVVFARIRFSSGGRPRVRWFAESQVTSALARGGAVWTHCLSDSAAPPGAGPDGVRCLMYHLMGPRFSSTPG